MTIRSRAARIAAGTPPDRDRLADFLRVVAILLVLLGHWLVAVVLVEDGRLVPGRLLDMEPGTVWLTWLFQVMPLFFLVGGFVNARSWRHAQSNGQTWAAWTQHRLRPLLAPVVPLLVLWALIVAVASAAGISPELVQQATQVAFAPLWFLATYVAIIALMPATWTLHRRFGLSALVGFAGAAAAVDAASRLGVPWLSYANLWFVWAGIHQCGYFWPEARRLNKRVGVAMLAAGLAALVLLVTMGGYPASMVTVGGKTPNNAGPPTVALFPLVLAQLGLVLLTQRPLERWLKGPRAWAAIVVMGRLTLSIYLWHVTALILAVVAVHGSGLWEPTHVDAFWWATRPLWILLCSIILALLLLATHPFESLNRKKHMAGPGRTAIGVAAVVAAIAWINRRGYDAEVPWVSLIAAVSLVIGMWAIGAIPHPRLRDGGEA